MPARLRLFGAERRSEGIGLPERGRGCLAVQLSRLSEIRVAFVKVLRGKQPTSLADCRRQNRRIDSKKSALVEKIADRLFDLVPNYEDRALARTAEPEVA